MKIGERREREIIELLADGKTGQEIADSTGLTSYAIKWYTQRIMRGNGLYGIADRRRLIAMAAKGELRVTTNAS